MTKPPVLASKARRSHARASAASAGGMADSLADSSKGSLERSRLGDSSSAEADSIDSLIRAAARAPGSRFTAELSVGMRLLDGRFVIERNLGQGGMGAVYVAHDRERSGPVALKTFLRHDADAVYRIKQEFRSLVDVLHPNLVRLYELFEDAGRWFFTMELLSGKPFFEVHAADTESAAKRALGERFTQLFAGISAIHRAGKLHRDLKPSNVLVTLEGRVVILDFGLASDATHGGVGQTIGDSVSGTPAYMAPEQAAGHPTTEASDWYAFGVMLYQALCGRLPFDGRTGEVLVAKQQRDAPPPSSVNSAVDPALAQLCVHLLARDPAERAGAAQIQAVLAACQDTQLAGPATGNAAPSDTAGPHTAPPSTAPARASDPPSVLEQSFVGRDAELGELRRAYDDVDARRPIVALLPGRSGMGKTMLMERFCAAVSQQGGALVLSGRCYERENVPYKAIDGVIDVLSRHLRQLEPEQAAALMPRDVQLVARLFPVLSRVPCVEAAPRRDLAIDDPQQLRSRAFSALAELLGRIADRRRLIVALDDLQWMDKDSARLILGVLGATEPPSLLLIASYREEEFQSNQALATLRSDLEELNVHTRSVAVAPLSDGDVRKLLRQARGGVAEERVVDGLAREAEGSPLFAVRLAQSRAGADDAACLTFDQVLSAQIGEQSADARALLRAASLSASPAPVSVLQRVCGVHQAGDSIAELRQHKLIRALEGGGDPRVVAYHDRIRESVVASLDASESKDLHEKLATAWQSQPDVEPETLVSHWLEAGQQRKAGPLALRAARQARAGMAFDRAALRFRQALSLLEPKGDERRELLIELAEALGAAGDGPDSADVYLEAAELSSTEERKTLHWKAAEHLLFSSNAPDAAPLLFETLPELGVPVPGLWRRRMVVLAEFARVGMGHTNRVRLKPEAARDPDVARRFDLAVATSQGLWFSPNSELFMYFVTLAHGLGGLSGEPGRAAHASCLAEQAKHFLFGADRRTLLQRLAEYREVLAQSTEPAARAHGLYGLATTELLISDLRRAAQDFERAARELSGLPGALAHLALAASMMQYYACWNLGDFETVRRIGREVQAAEARGNRTVQKKGRIAMIRLALVSDDLAEARRQLELCNDVVPWDRPGMFEAEQLEVAVLIELYEANPEVAVEMCREAAPKHKQNIFWGHVVPGYSQALVECAARDPASARSLHREAERLARWYERKLADTVLEPIVTATRAAIAFQRGEHDRALTLLAEVEESFAGREMAAYRELAMRQRGLLLGGDQGQQLVAEADRALRARGVKTPERFTHAHLAGFRKLSESSKRLPSGS